MNKCITSLLFVGFVGTVAAQAGQKDMPKTAIEKDMMKPVMVTGCVAESGGMYKLDHAMTSADMKNMSGADMNSKKMMSYMLMGGDLKGHVGHKVEVTGTMSKENMSKDTMSKDRMSKDMMQKDSMGMMMAGTLNVKSVKMISAACP